uniref:Grh/CP2 DB domain-containing protein n=1 Tax=Romanomermis culicivorax TaxID=13658 RepID=A0A915IVW2_ROMCU
MNVNLPRLGINAVALPSICTTSGSLETPPVLHENKTPLLRVAVAQSIADDQTPSTVANSIGVIAGQNSMTTGGIPSWPMQDFDNIPVGFDGSLSGLSDLNNTSGYMNDMLELVKRQSMQAASSSSMQATPSNSENYFQFILMAPTSSAVKIQEEPLTYLNQSQSYEIKCKKLNSNEISGLNRLYKVN